MPIIQADNLAKIYRVFQKKPGLERPDSAAAPDAAEHRQQVKSHRA